MRALILLLGWLLGLTNAQLYEYGIINPPHTVVDVFDVPQSRGSSHCYDDQGNCSWRARLIGHDFTVAYNWARVVAIQNPLSSECVKAYRSINQLMGASHVPVKCRLVVPLWFRTAQVFKNHVFPRALDWASEWVSAAEREWTEQSGASERVGERAVAHYLRLDFWLFKTTVRMD